MRSYILAIILLIGMLVPVMGRADGPTVVINELMWMGSSVSSSDEWIELRNQTDRPIDLSNWKLTKKSSGVEKPMLTIPIGKSIPAGGYFLISRYAPGSSSALVVSPDLVTADLSLVNSALQIKLYDAAGSVVDTADDGAGEPLAGNNDSTNKVFASMERNKVPGDGTLPLAWHTSNKSIGWKDAAVELGTPGSVNSNAKPAAEAGEDVSSSVGMAVSFDGSKSYDPDQDALTWRWDFGDGQAADGAIVSHAYATAGVFTTMLIVSDNTDSVTDTLTVTVTSANAIITNTNISNTNNGTVGANVTSSCRGLELISLLPNPVGSDTAEEIVVKNNSAVDINVNGCTIMVGTKKWTISGVDAMKSGVVAALLQTKTHLSLSNNGAIVKLIDVDGAVLDKTTYPAADEGSRWVKTDGKWAWDKAPVKSTAKTSKKKATTKDYEKLGSLEELQTKSSGKYVIARGTVTAPVEALGAKMTMIEDDSAAAAVTFVEPLPKLAVGDVISVAGKVRTLDGRRRITADKSGVKIVGHAPRSAKPLKLDELQIDDNGRLVSVSGLIASISGSRFVIDDGTAEITISIKSSTGIMRPSMAAGDKAFVVGIVSAGTTGLKIIPRVKDDIRIERVLGAATSTNPTAVPMSKPGQTLWYWGVAALGIIAGNGKKIWTMISRRKEKS